MRLTHTLYACTTALLLAILTQEACQGDPAPRSVVLVSLDTLRADRLGAWGNPDGLTPNMDELAKSSVVFRNTWSQANVTLHSHASLFTSRYPSELGAMNYAPRSFEGHPTLAEVLSIYGFQTGAAVAGAQVKPGSGIERGFDSYFSTEVMGSLYHTVPKAIEWLDARDEEQPFFLFLHGYDTHSRYLRPTPFGFLYSDVHSFGPSQRAALVPLGINLIFKPWFFNNERSVTELRPLRGRSFTAETRRIVNKMTRLPRNNAQPWSETDHRHLTAIYDGAVSYADAFLGLFLRRLQARHLLDQVMLVVVSDHGESLGENNIYGHGYNLSDGDVHVPLIIRLPGGEGGGRQVEELVALLDVMATILDWLDIPAPAGIHGQSLLPAILGQEFHGHDAVFTEGFYQKVSARCREGMVVFTGLSADSTHLSAFLQTTPLDADAWQNSAVQDATLRESLRQAMLRWRLGLQPAAASGEPTDPEILRALQKDGYWEVQ